MQRFYHSNAVRLYSGHYKKRRKRTFMEKYVPQLYWRNKDQDKDTGFMPLVTTPLPLPIKKVVVFDLDETIGSFGDLYELWCELHHRRGFPKEGDDEPIFHELMSLYPEMLRVGLMPILEFLYQKFRQRECYPIHIYTNTQCNAPRWVPLILSYLQKQIVPDDDDNQVSLFAKPICAFKIDGKRVEPERTTKNKCPSDFIRCSLLPKHVEICFVDDQPHPRMQTGKIYFIQPPPYHHPLTREIILQRFINSILYPMYFSSSLSQRQRQNQSHSQSPWTKKREYVAPDPMDIQIGQKILYYVREFFLVEYHYPDMASSTTKDNKTRRSIASTKLLSSTMRIKS